MAKRKVTPTETRARVEKTRSKIEYSPFKSVGEMNKVSEELRMDLWKRFENARIVDELMNTNQFANAKKELAAGVSCQYGEADELVRAYSDGVGIKITLNKGIFSEVKEPEEAESIIRAVADTFSKSYYEIKGLAPSQRTIPEMKRVK